MTIGILPAEGKLASTLIRSISDKTDHAIMAINSDGLEHLDAIVSALSGVEGLALINHYDGLDSKLEEHKLIIQAAKVAGVKKIVYASIIGEDNSTEIAPVVNIHRETEAYLKKSEMDYVILRNGLYIGADLEYIPEYRKIAKIENCADTGLCSYTSRTEISEAFIAAFNSEEVNGQTFNITGEAITQDQLAHFINDVYGFDLAFENISVEKYRHLRTEALGEKFGKLITGVHESIKKGDFHVNSDFEKLVGRPHKSVLQMITEYKFENNKATESK